MCTIRYNSNTANRMLYPGRKITQWATVGFDRNKQILFLFYDFKNSFIITDYTAEIDRNNCFCFRRDSCFQLLIVHLGGMGIFGSVLLNIHKLDSSTTVDNR